MSYIVIIVSKSTIKFIFMKKLCFILFLTTLFALQSCQTVDCNNTNAIFDNHQPNEQVYKDELVKQVVPRQENFRYVVKGYEERNNNQYLNVTIHGDSICAEASLLVENPDNTIQNLIAVKADGYHHAELKGLQFTVERDSTAIVFVYKSTVTILD